MIDSRELKLADLIRIAEENAERERELELADASEMATWQDTLDALQIMRERGAPESLKDEQS